MNNKTTKSVTKRLKQWGVSVLLLCGSIGLHAEENNVIPTIQVGKSTLKVMGYAQSTYTVQRQGDVTTNALDMQRFIGLENTTSTSG